MTRTRLTPPVLFAALYSGILLAIAALLSSASPSAALGFSGAMPAELLEHDVETTVALQDPEALPAPALLNYDETALPSPDPQLAPRASLAVQSRSLAASPEVIALSPIHTTSPTDTTLVHIFWPTEFGAATGAIRILQNGSWGEWAEVDSEEYFDESGNSLGKTGSSDLAMFTEVDGIQARLTAAPGLPAAEASVVFYTVGVEAPPDAQSRTARAAPSSDVVTTDIGIAEPDGLSAPRPAITPRSTWGAKAFTGTPTAADVRGAVIHHTAGSNNYTQAAVPGIIRAIQKYHMETRGWSDVGYNFLVDKYGGIWEGRQGSLNGPIRGVHASSANLYSVGISVLGNYQEVAIPAAAVDSVTRLTAWALARADVKATDTFTYPYTYNGRSANHAVAVIGHRDVVDAKTACPGIYFYPLMGSIARNAADLQFTVAGDIVDLTRMHRHLTGDDQPALLATMNGTESILIQHSSHFGAGRQIGQNWSGLDYVTTGPALSGNGTVDIFGRHRRTGILHVYHTNRAGEITGTTVWGPGWERMSEIIPVGDWNNDGLNDVIAINKVSGDMLLYAGRGGSRVHPAVKIGNGWNNITSVQYVGDITGDSRSDLIAVAPHLEELIVYPANGRGGFMAPFPIMRIPTTITTAVQGGDLNGDGRTDLVMQDSSGHLLTAFLDNRGFVTSVDRWGQGSVFARAPMLLGVSSWGGTGKSALIFVDPSSGHLFAATQDFQNYWQTITPLGFSPTAIERTPVGDITGTGISDLVEKEPSGLLFLLSYNQETNRWERQQVGNGWGLHSNLTMFPDINGDQLPEIATIRNNGVRYIYSFITNGTSYSLRGTDIESGFSNSQLTVIPNPPGDIPMVLNLDRSTGTLTANRVSPRGELIKYHTLGTSWHKITKIVATGERDGQGRSVILVTDNEGNIRQYALTENRISGGEIVTGIVRGTQIQ